DKGEKTADNTSTSNISSLKEDVIKSLGESIVEKGISKVLEQGKNIEGTENKNINYEKVGKALEKVDVKNIISFLKEGKVEEAVKELNFSLKNLSSEEKKVVLESINKEISREPQEKIQGKEIPSNREYKVLEGVKDIPKEEVKILKDFLVKTKEDISTKLSNFNEVKDGLKGKGEVLKEVIRQVLNGDVEKIPKEFIKEVKFFNEVSKEYYYMDVPIKAKDKDYGCKIIVKDKRGEGVAIDSKNMKLIVSVDAPKMGKVDGYLRIYDKNMSITLKAKAPFHNVLNVGKEKLCSYIRNLGYNVTVEVQEKNEDIHISNCSEFFNDYRTIALNTLV
ncbi:hypothetical protein, partial [Clostridium sp.]|uniref:hypothetical protein n=1 Tax=Clostridium sp. TaxID=1506 RepID=UPI00346493F4